MLSYEEPRVQESQLLLSPVLISPEVIPGLPFGKPFFNICYLWIAFIFGTDKEQDQ